MSRKENCSSKSLRYVQQLEQLESQYEELMASGDTEAAEAILVEINALKEEVDGIQSQIKQTINERYMVC